MSILCDCLCVHSFVTAMDQANTNSKQSIPATALPEAVLLNHLSRRSGAAVHGASGWLQFLLKLHCSY